MPNLGQALLEEGVQLGALLRGSAAPEPQHGSEPSTFRGEHGLGDNLGVCAQRSKRQLDQPRLSEGLMFLGKMGGVAVNGVPQRDPNPMDKGVEDRSPMAEQLVAIVL